MALAHPETWVGPGDNWKLTAQTLPEGSRIGIQVVKSVDTVTIHSVSDLDLQGGRRLLTIQSQVIIQHLRLSADLSVGRKSLASVRQRATLQWLTRLMPRRRARMVSASSMSRRPRRRQKPVVKRLKAASEPGERIIRKDYEDVLLHATSTW